MEDKKGDLKILTLKEATLLLPKVQSLLQELRGMEREIVAQQARVDLEELVSRRGDGSLTERGKNNRDQQLSVLNECIHEFYKKVNTLEELGCVLKDFKNGLVDFYSLREGVLVFLCWQDGEEQINFWHALQGGYATRQSL